MSIHVDPTIYSGRPASPEGRSPAELRCYDILDSLGISYLRADHEQAMTIADCENIETLLGGSICKNLFLCNRNKTAYYLLLLSGHKPFQTKELAAQLGCGRLSFGSPDAMLELLGLTPGSVSLLGLIHDTSHQVRLLLDQSVAREEYLYCHPCANTSTLRLRMEDVMRHLLPHLGVTPTLVELP